MPDNAQIPPLMLPLLPLPKPKQKRALIKKAGRISRILELRVKGYTLEQIATELKCNESTIRRNLKDEPTQAFIDTLMRAQLADILEAKTGTRLHYRDKLLEKLMPRKVESKTEGKLDIAVDKGKDIADLLTKYDTLFRPVEERSPGKNDSHQQVDPTSTDTQTS
jgi:transcriptional regulator with XRE-family HTH domain